MSATDGGVFAVARGIWDHPKVAPSRPFDPFAAWLWLLSSATWKACRVGGRRLDRGEFAFSIRFLADKWGWHRARVERFLKMLEREGMVSVKAETLPRQQRDTNRDTNRDSVKAYSICNYSRFQVAPLPKRDTNRDTHESDLNENRDKEEARSNKTPLSKERGTRKARARSGSPTGRAQKTEPNLQVLDGGKTETKPDPWKEVFDFGKSFMGPSSGGLIGKLKKLYIDAPYVAMTKLHEAKTKTKPAAWLASFLFHCHDPNGRLDGEYIGDVTGEIA